MEQDIISVVCPQCDGIPRPLITHILCNGTGLIDGQPDPVCNGTGQILDDVCGFCNDALRVKWGYLNQDLIDKFNDMENKLDDIINLLQT